MRTDFIVGIPSPKRTLLGGASLLHDRVFAIPYKFGFIIMRFLTRHDTVREVQMFPVTGACGRRHSSRKIALGCQRFFEMVPNSCPEKSLKTFQYEYEFASGRTRANMTSFRLHLFCFLLDEYISHRIKNISAMLCNTNRYYRYNKLKTL